MVAEYRLGLDWIDLFWSIAAFRRFGNDLSGLGGWLVLSVGGWPLLSVCGHINRRQG